MARPTVMTEDVLRKLEYAFTVGATDIEACFNAGIGESTLYDYCSLNPKFSERKEVLKNQPSYQAKVIINESLKEGDLNTANRVIDRKEGSKVNTVLSGFIETDNVFNFIGVNAED